MASRFLFNAAIWKEFAERVPEAGRVRAAVAYLGSGASSLLPLRKGDRLVVDMSLRSVRAGATDPKEVRKYLRRGVEVFSRASLHAKFVIIDRQLIAGSANISGHAQNQLDEAAVITDDRAAVARAVDVFEQLCTEPVRKEYLDKCIKEYRPPQMAGSKPAEKGAKKKQVVSAKLWVRAGLRYLDLPEAEQETAAEVAERAAKLVLDYEQAEVDYTHYPAPQKVFDAFRVGDWIIRCIRDARGFDVYPPARFLGVESYSRGDGKRRYLVLVEAPTKGGTVRWTKFRATARGLVPSLDRTVPRSMPISDEVEADALLRLWDSRGRFRAGRPRP